LGERRSREADSIYWGGGESFADPFEIRAARLGKKVRAGCEFIQTQCIYNIERFSKWMEMVRDRGLHEKCAILAGVTPFKSVGMAKYMKNSVPGMDVPDELIDRLKSVPKEKQSEEGIKMCVESIQRLREILGAGDSYHGDRVGGEGGGDCQGRRTPAQTTTLIPSFPFSKGDERGIC